MRHLLQKPYSIFLEGSQSWSGNQNTLLFEEPEQIIEANTLSEVGIALERVEKALQRGRWLAGYVSYEAGFAFEKKLQSRLVETPLPLVWFGEYRAPLLDAIEFGLSSQAVAQVRWKLTKEEYQKAIAKILAYIESGDVYQVNFTGKLTFDFQGDALGLYETLRRKQVVAYAAWLNLGEHVVLSFSPECFFRITDGVIEAKPMKGTARRGRTTQEDQTMAEWLRQDEKNRAENLMIVDLIRNDMGRICKTGSITFPSLFEIERYQTLFQMTSTVRGELKENITFKEIFEALFPCGSITGAPKIRAIEIIDELEAEPRGIYTGAIGYISPKKEACFSVAIRTVVLKKQGQNHFVGEMGIGSGITIDSESESEYDECWLKANFLTKPVEDFALIESIRFHRQYKWLEKHLARMKNSAHYFDFHFDEGAVRRVLNEYAQHFKLDQAYKVRLCLSRTGELEVSHLPLEQTGEGGEEIRIAIAERRTNSADKFFYHKTTHRQMYDEALQLAHQLGLTDFIFLNERDELAEGAMSNIFVEKEGILYTPPISAGILAGVYRGYVLETNPRAREWVLKLEDLKYAERIWICNAIRGMREAKLVRV